VGRGADVGQRRHPPGQLFQRGLDGVRFGGEQPIGLAKQPAHRIHRTLDQAGDLGVGQPDQRIRTSVAR
jgi:hypothetical protein